MDCKKTLVMSLQYSFMYHGHFIFVMNLQSERGSGRSKGTKRVISRGSERATSRQIGQAYEKGN